MNIKHSIQLFLPLFIDGYEYYYYGQNAFMYIWITAFSVAGKPGITIKNPQRTQDHKHTVSEALCRIFENAVMQYFGTCCLL